jgi:hypothetical protein
MADQPSPRRRFQFRLRTLFVLVAVVAAACWVVVDRQRLIRERDEAIRRESEARQSAESNRIEAQTFLGQIVEMEKIVNKMRAKTPTVSSQP